MTDTYQFANRMRAIGLTRKPEIGGVVDALEMVSVPVAQPKPNEVAIQLCASSMHIDEIYAAQGTALGRFFGPKHASPEQPHIIGSSVSGVVVGLGKSVDRFDLGDQVIVIPEHTMETGSWADYRCVRQDMVMLKSPTLSHVEAAALTMAACVAYGAVEKSKAKEGDRCLVVGASGAIGVMMVQYLKTNGCYVTGVCSGKSSELAMSKGVDRVIDYTTDNFADIAQASNECYDRILDCVGGLDIERDGLRALKPRGFYTTVVGPMQYIGEHKLSWLEVSKVVGYVLRRMTTSKIKGPRYVFGEKLPRLTIHAALNQAVEHSMRMPIERIVPFELNAIKEAVRLLTTHRVKGRIVIDFERSS